MKMMQAEYRPIDVRVSQSLQRVGYSDVQVADLGNGQIKLTGTISSEQDRAILLAVARAVVGVRGVVLELT